VGLAPLPRAQQFNNIVRKKTAFFWASRHQHPGVFISPPKDVFLDVPVFFFPEKKLTTRTMQ
jgi:hypothetical protein